MATLTLTDEEKAANLYNDKELLASLVKHGGLKLGGDAEGKQITTAMAYAMILAGMTHSKNADTMKISLKNATYDGKQIGDWKLTLKRAKARTPKGTR